MNIVYAQESLSSIKPGDLVFFLAGPTTSHYSWRADLIQKVGHMLADVAITTAMTAIPTLWFLVPEGRHGPWQELEKAPCSFRDTDPALYESCKLPFLVINQIQWETLGLSKGYVIYNMCQHWRLDVTRGQHGNIGPTSRMEVCPQYCDREKWIFYNNEKGAKRCPRANSVSFGCEAPGEAVGWLQWWIAKRHLQYMTSEEDLLSCIKQIYLTASTRQTSDNPLG